MDTFPNGSSYFVDQWLKHHGSQLARKCSDPKCRNSDGVEKASLNGCPAGSKNWMMGRSEYVGMGKYL